MLYEVDIHIPRNGLQSHTNSSESSTVLADGDVKVPLTTFPRLLVYLQTS